MVSSTNRVFLFIHIVVVLFHVFIIVVHVLLIVIFLLFHVLIPIILQRNLHVVHVLRGVERLASHSLHLVEDVATRKEHSLGLHRRVVVSSIVRLRVKKNEHSNHYAVLELLPVEHRDELREQLLHFVQIGHVGDEDEGALANGVIVVKGLLQLRLGYSLFMKHLPATSIPPQSRASKVPLSTTTSNAWSKPFSVMLEIKYSTSALLGNAVPFRYRDSTASLFLA